jgi:putative nucleotidyltransferase with HDIG domain
MHSALSSALRSPRFAPLPESAAAALRLLSDGTPVWQELAGVAARDAAFSHALLASAPLARAEWNRDLSPLLARRLEHLGADILRAWLLHVEPPPAHARQRGGILAHSLMGAECALSLATEMGYPRLHEAYLAGLWHDLGRLWLLAAAPDYAEYAAGFSSETALAGEERRRYGQDHAALGARLAAEAGAPIHLVDAIALHHALEEQAVAAHPLATLLWAAEALASEDHDTLLAAVSRVTSLGESTLLRLRAELLHRAAADPQESGGSPLDGLPAIGMSLSLSSGVPPGNGASKLPAQLTPAPNDYWRNVAMQGLLRAGFAGISAAAAGERLDTACRLLFGRPRPFVIGVESDGELTAAPVPGLEETGQLFDEFQLRLDDEASVVALAARTGATTSHFPGPHSPGRSPRDWHLARWLAAPGLLCLPCRSGQEQYVAVFGIDEHLESGAPEQSLMALLAASAATVLVEQSRRKAAETALQANLEQRYRDHARRIVHEVNNPLTVIRNYLDMFGQRPDAGETLRDELGLLNKELDRIGNLLQGIVQPPPANAEPPRSSLPEVLQELRALYGEPLFARRNIDLDLRTVAGLPAARIPSSVLKQVLLNLFRNASEALLDGGKFSVSTPGTVLVDGVACVEIRLIDNGPGIPAERLARLYEPGPSAKPGHQGVGLSICQELLAAWQASMLCRSQAGSGTSFQIFIPLAQRT